MIVADASLLIQLAVVGEQTALAEAVFERDPIWIVPMLWRSEVLNGLVKYFHLGLMEFESIMVSWHMAEEAVGGREYAVDARKVLELATHTKCSSYDCEYVALAQDLGVSLVTTDRRIIKAFPKTAVPLEKFGEEKNEPEVEHHRDAGRAER